MDDENLQGGSDAVGFDDLVGANIRAYRTAIGMSQLELAEALSRATGERIHQQTILKIEKGTRPLKYSEAVSMADVLQVPQYMLLSRRDEGAANGVLLQVSRELQERRAALAAFAADLAPDLVDVALVLSVLEQNPPQDADGSPLNLEAMTAVAESWLFTNWGKELNREIMTALRRQDFLTDIREEFEADSYLEVLQNVKNTEVRFHPSMSKMAPLDALKSRPKATDESET